MSRRSIARANRSFGVMSDAGSLSGDAAGLDGRCVVGSGRRTGANVSPFTSTGPPQKGHRQMVLSPIPAFSERQIACHGEADGFDAVAEQVAEFGTPAVLVARTGTPNPEGASDANGAAEILPATPSVGPSAAKRSTEGSK